MVSWSIADRNKDFFILYFLLLSGVFGVFATVDLFFFFFFYELAVLPMYLLIGVWGSSSKFPTFSRTKEYSALKLMLYLVAGSVLVWIAILAIFVEGGLGTFNMLELENAAFSETFQRVFFPSAITVWLSAMRLRLVQTGRMYNYGMAMALGVFALALIWWVVQT